MVVVVVILDSLDNKKQINESLENKINLDVNEKDQKVSIMGQELTGAHKNNLEDIKIKGQENSEIKSDNLKFSKETINESISITIEGWKDSGLQSYNKSIPKVTNSKDYFSSLQPNNFEKIQGNQSNSDSPDKCPEKETGLKKPQKKKRSCYKTFSKLMEKPINYVCWLTVLPVEKRNYSRTRAGVYPIFGVYFFICCITLEWYNMWYVYIGFPLVIALYILFFFALPKNGDCPKWFSFFIIVGVLSGVMWTQVLVGILIDLLNAFGVILGLSKTYLGLTVLAMGNAMPECMTTVIMVRRNISKNDRMSKDNVKMAIIGCYSSQLFGLLIGFGISMQRATLSKGPQTFDLYELKNIEYNIQDIITMLTAQVCLLVTFFWGIFNKFVMSKGLGYILLSFYGSFQLSTTVIAICNAYKNY